MAKLSDIDGIGEMYAAQLRACGVRTQTCLLEQGATPVGRKQLAAKTGISGTLLLKWINRADLMRIRGIGSEFAELLETAGIDSVPELARRNGENLYKQLQLVGRENGSVRRLPSESLVYNWVEQAKKLK